MSGGARPLGSGVPARPASWPAMVLALAANELRLALRRGESLLVTFVIPVGVLVVFSAFDLGGATDGSGPVDRILPGAMTLAVIGTSMVSLAIATGFERAYGVLKRLGGSPAGPSSVVAAKTVGVAVIEVVQVALLVAVAAGLLGWAPGPAASAPLVLLALVLGTVAFAGLGLLMAGTLRAEATLALANLLFLVALVIGGIVVPVDRLPDAVAAVAAVLPPALLDRLLTIGLGAGRRPGRLAGAARGMGRGPRRTGCLALPLGLSRRRSTTPPRPERKATNRHHSRTTMPADKLRQLLTVVAFVATLVVNVAANALPINGVTTGEISDRFAVYVIPAGYVFGIWGLIYLLLGAFTTWQALPRNREDAALRDLGLLPAWTGVLNLAWVLLWHHEVFVLTVPVMLTLLVTLITIHLRLVPYAASLRGTRYWTIRAPWSVYLGWITVATIANVAQTLASLGFNGFGLPPAWLGGAVLLLGLVIAVVFVRRYHDAAYGLVIAWAYAGIVVKEIDAPVVALVAGVGAALMALLAVAEGAGGRGRGTTSPAGA